MALANSEWLQGNRAYKRISAARFALGAVAMVFGALWAFGALAAVPAVVAVILIGAAILVGRAGTVDAPHNAEVADPGPPAELLPILDTVLAGLPQPVIALD